MEMIESQMAVSSIGAGPFTLLGFSSEVTAGQRGSWYAGIFNFWRQNDKCIILIKSMYL